MARCSGGRPAAAVIGHCPGHADRVSQRTGRHRARAITGADARRRAGRRPRDERSSGARRAVPAASGHGRGPASRPIRLGRVQPEQRRGLTAGAAPGAGCSSDTSDHHGERDRHGPGRRLRQQRPGPAAGAPPAIVEQHRRAWPARRRRTRPAAAPASVSPRHQMPSTSSGQNVDAASAKASPTVSARPVAQRRAATARPAPRPRARRRPGSR